MMINFIFFETILIMRFDTSGCVPRHEIFAAVRIHGTLNKEDKEAQLKTHPVLCLVQ